MKRLDFYKEFEKQMKLKYNGPLGIEVKITDWEPLNSVKDFDFVNDLSHFRVNYNIGMKVYVIQDKYFDMGYNNPGEYDYTEEDVNAAIELCKKMMMKYFVKTWFNE